MNTLIHNVRIVAINAYLPTRELDLSSLSNEYGQNEVNTIIKTTGIERVRICENNQTSSDLCYESAKALIEAEKIDKMEIDGLVFVSQTTDYILPASSIILQDRLGLNKETVCIDIHYGCSGYIYGLFQAALWVSSGACSNVLVLAGDTTSKMIHDKDKSLRMVFGDCGTATLVSKGDSSMAVAIGSDGSGYDKLIVPAGGFRQPLSDLTKKVNFDADFNGRSLENIYMDGMAILHFAITHVHKNIETALHKMNWKKEEVNLFALHQANEFMINYIRKKLKVEPDKVPVNVKNYGNTGPATIPLLLSDLYSSAKPELQKVVLSGFGVGLSWGSIACNLSDTHFYEPINK